ncbi:hypothetical protein [Endothiovibrio diazotrophicus]
MIRALIEGGGRFAKNPYVSLLVGLAFLYTGVSDAVRELEALGHLRVGVHHGVILFALLHILKTLPDLVDGTKYLRKGECGEH